MSLVSITSENLSNESALPFYSLDILYSTYFIPSIVVVDAFCNFVYIDLLCGADTEIANFSKMTLIMTTELDTIFPFSSRDVKTEDKNEQFDLMKA